MGNKFVLFSACFFLLFVPAFVNLHGRDMITRTFKESTYCLFKKKSLTSRKQAVLLSICPESNTIISFTELTGNPVDMVFHNNRLFVLYEKNLMRYAMKDNKIDKWTPFSLRDNLTIRGAGKRNNQLVAIASDHESLHALAVTDAGFEPISRFECNALNTQSHQIFFVESTATDIGVIWQDTEKKRLYLTRLTDQTFSQITEFPLQHTIRSVFSKNRDLVIVLLSSESKKLEFYRLHTGSGRLIKDATVPIPDDRAVPDNLSVLHTAEGDDQVFFHTDADLEWFSVQQNTLKKNGSTRFRDIELSLLRKTIFLLTMVLIITLFPAAQISSKRIQRACAHGERNHFFCPLWRRISGFLIDSMIFFNVLNLVSSQTFAELQQINIFRPDPEQLQLAFIQLMYLIIYGSVFEGVFGRTPGKFILNERVVVAETSEKCEFTRAIIRNTLPRFSLIMVLGAFTILFSRNKQSLRDFIAKTAVVDNQTWIMHQQKKSLTAY